jgi:hypothetical protein
VSPHPCFQKSAQALRSACYAEAGANGIRDPNQHQFLQVILCLPMTPGCQFAGNGDFGGSPFCGQLSGKQMRLILSEYYNVSLSATISV